MAAATAQKLDIEGLLLIRPKRIGDARGDFTELFQNDAYAALGVAGPFAQDNLARSSRRGVVRGLHFQSPPAAQGKLVFCLRGAIFDVALDLRRGSPSYGRCQSVRLDAADGAQIWLPAGFAHGYAVLEDDSWVAYKTTAPYRPDCEGGLRWNDPGIGVKWPLDAAEIVVSPRDQKWPDFADFISPFE
jgi:dTDP-4-dehydrorhamnose 3,5-epimerase